MLLVTEFGLTACAKDHVVGAGQLPSAAGLLGEQASRYPPGMAASVAG